MIICEHEFDRADPKNPDYAMTEVDYYSHVPYGSDFPQHRLTLRKCLKTGKYQAIRAYAQRFLISRKGLTIDTGKETGQIEVAFEDEDLKKVVGFLNGEVHRFWAALHKDRADDKVCDHRPPNVHHRCPEWQKVPADEKIRIFREIRRVQQK